MAVTAEKVEVRASQRTCQQLVAHRSAVHEQKLRNGRPTRVSRQGGKPRKVQTITLRINRQRVFCELFAQNRRQPAVQRSEQIALLCRGLENLTVFTLAGYILQREVDKGLCHGKTLDHVGDRLRFGPVGTQKFQPRGCRVKQIAQGNRRAVVAGRWPDFTSTAPFHRKFDTLLTRDTCCHRQTPNSRQRRQCLSAKAECMDVQQIATVNL